MLAVEQRKQTICVIVASSLPIIPILQPCVKQSLVNTFTIFFFFKKLIFVYIFFTKKTLIFRIFKTQIIRFLFVMLRVRNLTGAQQLCLLLDNLDNIFFSFLQARSIYYECKIIDAKISGAKFFSILEKS